MINFMRGSLKHGNQWSWKCKFSKIKQSWLFCKGQKDGCSKFVLEICSILKETRIRKNQNRGIATEINNLNEHELINMSLQNSLEIKWRMNNLFLCNRKHTLVNDTYSLTFKRTFMWEKVFKLYDLFGFWINN